MTEGSVEVSVLDAGGDIPSSYVTFAPFHVDLEIPMPRPQDIAPTYDQVIESILCEREASALISVLEPGNKIDKRIFSKKKF